jgi:hypothetical protein
LPIKVYIQQSDQLLAKGAHFYFIISLLNSPVLVSVIPKIESQSKEDLKNKISLTEAITILI